MGGNGNTALGSAHAAQAAPAVVEAARRRFGREGYDAVALEDLVGADAADSPIRKRELFEASFEREEQIACELAAMAYAHNDDPLEAGRAACRAYVDHALTPGARQILLVDGPRVLGYQRVRAIEESFGLDMIKSGLRAAIDAGRIPAREVDALAHLIFGALCGSMTFVLTAPDPEQARLTVERDVDTLLLSLAS